QGPSLRPVRDDLAEVSAAYQPPRALQPESPMARPAHHFASQAVAQPATDSGPAYPADLLTQAFLNGAKLPMNLLPNGLTPELMAIVGSLLRSATTGAVDMLAARTATKLEVQANVTVISAQANNPLKFLPSGEVALQQLLSKRMPGFMPPDEAMKDAFDDLRAHEIGVIAGTRAALAEVLGRFDPNLLGQRLAAGSLLDSLLPSVRKTKLWDIYVDRYAQIRGEAEDDFQSIFGRAFVQAYERETARMKSQQSAPGAQT
ncbi:MAG: type VI secretion system-associated FHA domain protein TagH, partial [Rhodoferax sp.]